MLRICRVGPENLWYVYNGYTTILCTNNTLQRIGKCIGKDRKYTIKFSDRREDAEKALEEYLKSLSAEEFAEYVAERLKYRSETNG